MYHEGKITTRAYYDTMDEMPSKAQVTFPDGTTKEMSIAEMYDLSDAGWYTIMHSVNWGSCDHWTSQPLSKWVNERFKKVYRFVDGNNKTVGYNRDSWSVKLTKDSNYWKSEVWNS